jgi:hypothetical protein
VQSGVSPTGILPHTSWSSYTVPWSSSNSLFLPVGSNCYNQLGTTPSLGNPSSSGATYGSGAYEPSPSSGCSQYSISYSVWAGTHGSNTAWSPSTTGLYTFTAQWTLSFWAEVWVQCGSQGSGVSLPNYAQFNITPFIAMYNGQLYENYVVPNDLQTTMHMDTRDFYCSTSGGNPNLINFVEDYYGTTVSATTIVYLSSSDNYSPRAGIQFSMQALGVQQSSSGGYAYVAFGPQNSGGPVATLSSISIS